MHLSLCWLDNVLEQLDNKYPRVVLKTGFIPSIPGLMFSFWFRASEEIIQ